MPSRILREGILTSERVDKLSDQAELFYRRLMSVVDDFGRYYARPELLRAACYPLRVDRIKNEQIVKWRDECISAGLCKLHNGKSGTQIVELLELGTPRAKHTKFLFSNEQQKK